LQSGIAMATFSWAPFAVFLPACALSFSTSRHFKAAPLVLQANMAGVDDGRAELHRSCSVDGCNWVLEASLLPIGWLPLRLLAPRIAGARFPIQIRCSAEAWTDWRRTDWGWTCESASPTRRRRHSDFREHRAEMLKSGLSLQSAVG
jgi:hypothetical protein